MHRWMASGPKDRPPPATGPEVPCEVRRPDAGLANGVRPVPFRLVINPAPIQYKGADLDADRGPGLGCFRFQLAVLVVFVVLTPLTVVWQWPSWISAVLLFGIIGLLLVTGQTIIFLLRLVAADRRSRRRPLASATKTVGELDDDRGAATSPNRAAPRGETDALPNDPDDREPPTAASDEGPVRQ
jgi:hypothetical protein